MLTVTGVPQCQRGNALALTLAQSLRVVVIVRSHQQGKLLPADPGDEIAFTTTGVQASRNLDQYPVTS